MLTPSRSGSGPRRKALNVASWPSSSQLGRPLLGRLRRPSTPLTLNRITVRAASEGPCRLHPARSQLIRPARWPSREAGTPPGHRSPAAPGGAALRRECRHGSVRLPHRSPRCSTMQHCTPHNCKLHNCGESKHRRVGIRRWSAAGGTVMTDVGELLGRAALVDAPLGTRVPGPAGPPCAQGQSCR